MNSTFDKTNHKWLQKTLLIQLTFGSMRFKQPSLGTKAATFFPFLTSCTLAHLHIPEHGCLASIPLHNQTDRESLIIDNVHTQEKQIKKHILCLT